MWRHRWLLLMVQGALPASRLAAIKIPVLAVSGGASPPWLPAAARAAAATATVMVEIYAAAARALGVQMKAGFLGATTATPLTAASFAMGDVVCTFWGQSWRPP